MKKKIDLFAENIPNMLSISRIILTFVVIYLIFTKANIIYTIIIFSIAALTDFLDGQLARRFKWVSEFGRKADMIADRFLWIGTALAFVIAFGLEGSLRWYDGVLLLLIMTREIIAMPFALIAFFSGNALPHARYIAKATTTIQGLALPSLLLSVYYPQWIYPAVILAVVCSITGFISALYYIHDIKKK